MQLLGFLARYFAWVQHVFPWAPAIFDAILMVSALTVTPRRFIVQERLWNQILDLAGVSETSHRYGGREAVFQGRELCHIHGNGVLDFILPKSVDVPAALNTHIHPPCLSKQPLADDCCRPNPRCSIGDQPAKYHPGTAVYPRFLCRHRCHLRCGLGS